MGPRNIGFVSERSAFFMIAPSAISGRSKNSGVKPLLSNGMQKPNLKDHRKWNVSCQDPSCSAPLVKGVEMSSHLVDHILDY